jgi:2-polyprenyl-6-hydroxyphenyl methylase/3-demethylubiquinone-9 3-methyltransferase
LREAGFRNVEVYDPFVPQHAKKPEGKFDIITMFEVLEHSPTPKETMADLSSMLADEGVVMMSTMLQPKNMDSIGVNWWYLAPRNGHVSMHSRRSLTRLAAPFGMRSGSVNDGFHILVRGKPAFAGHIQGI